MLLECESLGISSNGFLNSRLQGAYRCQRLTNSILPRRLNRCSISLSRLVIRARYVKLNPIKGCGQARDSWVERGCVCLRLAWHFRTTAGVRRGKVTPILSIVLGSPYASFEIAEIGQALFDDLLLFRAVFERFRMRAVDGFFGRIVACGREAGGRNGALSRGRRLVCPRRGRGCPLRGARGSWGLRR